MPRLDWRINTQPNAIRRRMAIDRRASEESAARIPLQRTGAVCHFAKATNAVRDGCIQATGWLASAARIPPAANQECQLSPEPIAARAAWQGVITASSAERKGLFCLAVVFGSQRLKLDWWSAVQYFDPRCREKLRSEQHFFSPIYTCFSFGFICLVLSET